MKPHISHADHADLRRQIPKQQNSLNFKQPVFLCEIIQPCCIPLRHLRYLRENIHARVLNLLAQMKPQCLPQISQIYADKTPKLQNCNNCNNCNNLKQPVFLCEIMQLAAFLCVISAICGRISTQEYSSNPHKRNPNKSHADNRRQTPKRQNILNLKQPVFLCEIMQLAAFLCVICAICGRIFTQAYSINPYKQKYLTQIPQTNHKYEQY